MKALVCPWSELFSVYISTTVAGDQLPLRLSVASSAIDHPSEGRILLLCCQTIGRSAVVLGQCERSKGGGGGSGRGPQVDHSYSLDSYCQTIGRLAVVLGQCERSKGGGGGSGRGPQVDHSYSLDSYCQTIGRSAVVLGQCERSKGGRGRISRGPHADHSVRVSREQPLPVGR
jgi:hypothetical protein